MTESALIVVDMLNRYEHEDAEALIESVRETVRPISDLLTRARECDAPIIYVNDNYGDWGADRAQLYERALEGAQPELVQPVAPPQGSDFVTKARHSIFYETPLDYLLRTGKVSELILVGQVTEQCILYSALDGYVRHYSIAVPADAVAHIHPDLARAALKMMEVNMRARIVRAGELFVAGSAG